MDIRTLSVGPLGTNCYLLCDSGECCLIDPGEKGGLLMEAVAESGCALRYILLTHGHYDHYTAVAEILAVYPALPVYLHASDLSDEPEQLRMQRLAPANQRTYAEGDTLPLGSLAVTVLETPGHSAGSVVLAVGDGVLFTGDTLFRGSCGRTDLPGGDPRAMQTSLRRLAALAGDRRVLPGHGGESTLERERQYNYYLR